MIQFKVVKRPVIAITGSAGKTTTKEMMASILQKQCKVFKTKYNKNAPLDIVRQIKKINATHKALVMEYGMTRAGQIRRSCQLLQPNIGIVTTVGNAHIGNFGGSIKRLAKTKSELINGMKSDGMLFLNADNSNSNYLDIKQFKGSIYKVGIRQKADYKANSVSYTAKGMSFQVKLNSKLEKFDIPIFGEHNVYNALFAIAVSHQLGISPNLIRRGLQTYERPKSRLTIYPLKSNINLIDDSYSANPQATNVAIDVLTHIGKKNKIAVLANMLELGNYAKKGHENVGAYAAKKKIDHLITFGSLAKHIQDSAVKSGLPLTRAKHFIHQGKLHKYLSSIIKPNSTILVKGSNKMKLSQTIRFLRDNK